MRVGKLVGFEEDEVPEVGLERIFVGAVLVGQMEDLILLVGVEVDIGGECFLMGKVVGAAVGALIAFVGDTETGSSTLGPGAFFVGSNVGAILGS